MRVEVLGSGGATATPRPGCGCRVCTVAREHGPPHARTGPSVFVHGPNAVFDTPEESRLQLDRARLERIDACFYSHWHPDHTMGKRVWETRNGDFRAWPREAKRQTPTTVYLPEGVADDFRTYLGGWEHLAFMEERGWVRVEVVPDGATVELNGYEIRPFRLAVGYVYAFEIVGGDRRLLLAMDELNGWKPEPGLRGPDLAVLPMGICELDPFTGERRIHADHPVIRFEATFAETLAMVDALAPRRVVLHHVEELDGLTVDDLKRLEGVVGRNVTFAWDTMVVDV